MSIQGIIFIAGCVFVAISIIGRIDIAFKGNKINAPIINPLIRWAAAILGIFLISGPIYSAFFSKDKDSEVPVGTIVASLLPPAQFKAMRGIWLPSEGQAISKESLYYKLCNRENLPDMRGVFLRGLNEFTPGKVRSDEYADPEGTRSPGQLQMDAFKKHSHQSFAKQNYDEFKAPAGTNRDAGFLVPKSPNPTSEIGDKETRAKNVAVYYYIRVD